jgi:ABC-2 type transport system ATP-binding protein
MLEFVDLAKRYGNVVALDGCGFSVAPGRMVGFLGPNGSGKTTAMRSVFGLVAPDRGEVRWRDHRVQDADRLRFGYMPEERGLYPRMRAGEQVEYFARLHGLTAGDARRAAGAWLERLGLGDRTDARVEELSHGNQQRAQLAVALAHEPDLLVLDEPFAGLDPIGVAALGAIVREEAARGAAVVFSSHQLDLVEDLCDDVAIIDHGRLVLSGPLRQVRAGSRFRYVQVAFDGDGHGNGHAGAARADWRPSGAGVEVLWQRNGETRLRVPAGADPEPLLEDAKRAGGVEYFRFEPPSLDDLFMEAVGR